MIVSVDSKGPLGQVGFEVGDIMLEVNGRPIRDVEGLAGLLSTWQPRQRIAVLAFDYRTGKTGYVQVVVQ